MHLFLFGFIGMWEAVAIMAVMLILFGAKKLPELARGLGQGIKEFKKATNEVTQDLHRVFEDEGPTTPVRKLPAAKPKDTPTQPTEPNG